MTQYVKCESVLIICPNEASHKSYGGKWHCDDCCFQSCFNRFVAKLEKKKAEYAATKKQVMDIVEAKGGDQWLNSLIETDPQIIHDNMVPQDIKQGTRVGVD